MKGRGRGKAVFLAALFLLAAGGLYFYFHIYRVEPAFAEKTYEYGDAVSRDIADYLTGTDWSVHLGELDLSEVDETETGTYEAVVHHGSSSSTGSSFRTRCRRKFCGGMTRSIWPRKGTMPQRM